ncbi:MAG: UbiX family flavin prenyltransferase [Planctomycetes bacterium]|nr:UbiX family flavin prenyltransferase [Planctomycetota bacterium]
MRLVVAMTGASGALYGVRFVLRAVELGAQVDLVISAAGDLVARAELGFSPDPGEQPFADLLGAGARRVRRIPVDDCAADVASGSAAVSGMVVIPCSMGSLARIAAGTSQSLIERAADVTLKERRPLVLVPRETPLNRIHLRNMAAAAEAGAILLPAMPSFYAGERTIEDLVDTVVDRAAAIFFGGAALRAAWPPPRGEAR